MSFIYIVLRVNTIVARIAANRLIFGFNKEEKKLIPFIKGFVK
jgi:hypothetical protein